MEASIRSCQVKLHWYLISKIKAPLSKLIMQVPPKRKPVCGWVDPSPLKRCGFFIEGLSFFDDGRNALPDKVMRDVLGGGKVLYLIACNEGYYMHSLANWGKRDDASIAVAIEKDSLESIFAVSSTYIWHFFNQAIGIDEMVWS
jgi:hypothetical protein